MAPAGVEVLLEAHQDPSFGGVVGVGLGGAFTPADPSRPVRVLPLSDIDAHRLVDASPVADLLGSALDGPARRGLEALLVRLAAVVDRVPEIADVVLNPVLVGDEAVSITAGRVRVAPAVWDGAPPVRRLS
jgi:hypothetical protein